MGDVVADRWNSSWMNTGGFILSSLLVCSLNILLLYDKVLSKVVCVFYCFFGGGQNSCFGG